MPAKFWERPLVYIAGPYTNPDPIVNTRECILLADRLNDSGLVTCFVPHLSLLYHIVAPHEDIDYWYEYDMTMLIRSQAMFRRAGQSTGADGEEAFAIEHGIPVFKSESRLLDWALQFS